MSEEDYLDEDYYLVLENWLNNSQGILKEPINEDTLNLIKESFLEGFKTGRKFLNKYNWQRWNQK